MARNRKPSISGMKRPDVVTREKCEYQRVASFCCSARDSMMVMYRLDGSHRSNGKNLAPTAKETVKFRSCPPNRIAPAIRLPAPAAACPDVVRLQFDPSTFAYQW